MATCCAKNHYTPPIVLMQVNEAFWKTYTDENGVEKACYKSCDPNESHRLPGNAIEPTIKITFAVDIDSTIEPDIEPNIDPTSTHL